MVAPARSQGAAQTATHEPARHSTRPELCSCLGDASQQIRNGASSCHGAAVARSSSLNPAGAFSDGQTAKQSNWTSSVLAAGRAVGQPQGDGSATAQLGVTRLQGPLTGLRGGCAPSPSPAGTVSGVRALRMHIPRTPPLLHGFRLQCVPGSQVTEPGHIRPLSTAAGALAKHSSTGRSRERSSPLCHPGSLQGLSLGHQAGSVLNPLLRCFWKFIQGPKPQQSATTSVQAKGFQGNLSHHPWSSPSSCSPNSSGPCSDAAPPRLVLG